MVTSKRLYHEVILETDKDNPQRLSPVILSLRLSLNEGRGILVVFNNARRLKSRLPES